MGAKHDIENCFKSVDSHHYKINSLSLWKRRNQMQSILCLYEGTAEEIQFMLAAILFTVIYYLISSKT
jgi:hypothetical protein